MKSLKIAIVDDDADVSFVISELITVGCEIKTYTCPKTALFDIAETGPVDLLITDQIMPIYKGTELIKKMISRGLCRSVLIQSGSWESHETNELYKMSTQTVGIPVSGINKLDLVTTATTVIPDLLRPLVKDGRRVILYSNSGARTMTMNKKSPRY